MVAKSNSEFSQDIHLSNAPLIEAWLEIQWKLEAVDPPQLMRDPNFAFALGPFFENIREDYPVIEKLPTADAPEPLLPHVVRYRFRPGEDQWPILQIGPGVASINFTEAYTWKQFRKEALYLRENLLNAYDRIHPLECEALILRYRNAEDFNYNINNILEFMSKKLNVTINLPSPIERGRPNSLNLNLSFALEEPESIAELKFITASKTEDNSPTLVWEIWMRTYEDKVPPISDELAFSNWLDASHSIIHEWFLSLISSELLKKYK